MHEILEKIVVEPEKIKSKDIDELVIKGLIENSSELREAFFRIFDLNDNTPLGGADKGILGKLNRRSNQKRTKKVKKKLRQGNYLTRIYAEGDSWFQHPLIKEVIDHLNKKYKKQNYVIFNSAMGGDWLLNYLYGNKYIEEISFYDPSIILLSGGGNDIVGKLKLAYLVSDSKGIYRKELIDQANNNIPKHQILSKQKTISKFIEFQNIPHDSTEIDRLFNGFTFFTKEFFSIFWFLELSYKYLICNIRKKYKDLKIITQGYDYVVPNTKSASIFKIKRKVINIFMDNGHWLYDALAMRNIHNKQDQKDVMFTLIYCFNEMLLRVVNHDIIGKNVFHVDARGIATQDRDWYDEMHLSPEAFKKVANKFDLCIKNTIITNKVF